MLFCLRCFFVVVIVIATVGRGVSVAAAAVGDDRSIYEVLSSYNSSYKRFL